MARDLTVGFVLWMTSLGSCAALAQNKFTRPAPTAADWEAVAKLPDLTGVWEAVFGPPPPASSPNAANAAPSATTPAAAPSATLPTGPAGRPRARAGRGLPPPPPLTPEYAALAKAHPPEPPSDEQAARCLPPGLPGIMTQPYPYEFLLTPGQVTIISEAYSQVRHIYTDGRPLPADPDPNFFGTSVGHWEGDTLVAETIGLEQKVPRGIPFPYSDQLKVIERFRLTDPNTMTVETTLVDPKALTMPYSMGVRTMKRHRSWTIAEYICEENNRNLVDANGKPVTDLSNPLASPK